jgi:MFS transporter, DHA2 family, multidrug resistance protein
LQAIKGFQLVILTLAVSLGIFMNVLDTSIANVAIPTIAGYMGVSADNGTWVITSFSVSTAIVLPLTGWLAKRFGEVRLFVISTFLFTIASILCGLASSFPMLIIFRVFQGAVAGPMIPLSQSLLLANYPDEKKGLATALWAMVAVAAPVIGPILGGYITDNFSWPWIFYINVPVGIFSVFFTWSLLRDRETPIQKRPIDFMGLVLLAIGIACLQILLDKGKDLDWFRSDVIITLAIVSFVSLTLLVIWELTEEYPIIDLSLFGVRNFTVGTIALSLGYMVYFGSVVIIPLWLQTQYSYNSELNYTATWAGVATAPLGILPLIFSPIVGKLLGKIDLRVIVSIGFIVFGLTSFWQSRFDTDVDFNHIALVRFVAGLGAPCFFIPLLSILLSGLPSSRIASAAGLSNFLRILAGSFGTSLSVTLWDRRESFHQSRIVESLTAADYNFFSTINQLVTQGFTEQQAFATIYNVVINQAYMLATNEVFYLSGFIFLSLLLFIWFAKPPFLSKQR